MNSNRELQEPTQAEQRLGDMLLEVVRFIPLLTTLLAVGLLATYLLAQAGLLGTPAWQLLAVAGGSLVAGLLQLPVARLARRGRVFAAFLVFTVVLALWGFALIAVWQSALAVAILIVWVAPLTSLAARARTKVLAASFASGAVLTGLLVLLNGRPPFERMAISNQAGLAAVVLTASTVLLFVLGTTVVRLFRYRSLQGRLVLSFVLIITVAILFSTAISAFNSFNNSQELFKDSLQAVVTLKQGQTESVVNELAIQMSSLQQGKARGASLLHVLYPAGQSEEAYRLAVSTASTVLRDLLVQYPASHYEEAMIVDIHGTTVLSTYQLDHGLDVSKQDFFLKGIKQFDVEVMRFPGKQNFNSEYKIVAAAPIYGASNTDIRGVLVTVAENDVMVGITGPTIGIPNGRTYMVGTDTKVISGAPGPAPTVSAWPVVHVVLSKAGQTSNVYTNYRGSTVLGYVLWDSSINAAIVGEVPQSEVYSKALASVLVSALIGLFAIVVAAIAALSTAQAISKPISSLAGTAGAFASGNLDARAVSDQPDEVGRLALSFNAMADQLQDMIGNLEQRIAERTEALEQQTLRLRTAAEVARDAASAPGLDELLDQAARLIMDRFGFYHTGIFLVDQKHEYAVLRASPSEAGKHMLENRHQLRVGEQGIVGRVAATGEPRIALDTGVDPVYFSNPLLPNTHSEMALPLKTAEGTIGVIDIQSDQPEAFTQDDIAIVQVMADQLATAIQRTRLIQQVQSQLQQLEQTQQSFTQQSWDAFTKAGRPNIGYRFDNIRLEAIHSGNGRKPTAAPAEMGHRMEVPIRLRGQTIGVVTLRFQSEGVSDQTAQMIQQIADRLATALENARLLEDSLRRANRERAIGEITSKISASVNMRNVLQTAVEELGRAIPGSDVLIQFRPESEF